MYHERTILSLSMQCNKLSGELGSPAMYDGEIEEIQIL